jgi:branched-chain amino acid transport system ATP-binding protein
MELKQMKTILEVVKLSMNFGGLCAVNDFSFHVRTGEILGLIGPNGSGKTTLFNVISGVYAPTKGTILLGGEKIGGLPMHQIASKGLVRTFQSNEIFNNLSVIENVKSAGYHKLRSGLLGYFIKTDSRRRGEGMLLERAVKILSFIGIYDLIEMEAGNLPYGYQRLLGIGISLYAEPKLLLMDEPATGMNPEETRMCMNLINKIRETGITVVVVEHDMKLIMNLCDRIVVISSGKKIAEGIPEEIRKNKEVIDVYLGDENAYT